MNQKEQERLINKTNKSLMKKHGLHRDKSFIMKGNLAIVELAFNEDNTNRDLYNFLLGYDVGTEVEK